jgi:hypothetical protein
MLKENYVYSFYCDVVASDGCYYRPAGATSQDGTTVKANEGGTVVVRLMRNNYHILEATSL